MRSGSEAYFYYLLVVIIMCLTAMTMQQCQYLHEEQMQCVASGGHWINRCVKETSK